MAEKFTQHTGRVVPLDAANVDTDAIIPKQFLQKVTRTGFGAHLFNDWRFLDDKGEVKCGDTVLFGKYAGTEIKVDGNDYLVMSIDDILGVM